MLRSIGSVTFLALLMVGCGGGGGGSDSGPPPPPPPPNGYTVGGMVSGLVGSELALAICTGRSPTGKCAYQPGPSDARIGANGAFTFAVRLSSGTLYKVSVKTQPSSPTQNCVVTNGSGAVGTTNITTVAVACSTVAGYTVGGTVSGLVGSGLTLGICPASSSRGFPKPCYGLLQVVANGAFTLPAGPASDYIIAQQPSSPTQRCVISTDNTSVTVSCAEYSYVINDADNMLSSYSVDATTGALAAVGTPTATGTSPYAIVGLDIGEDKRYVYVGNEGSNDVSAFAVNPATGSLTAVPGSPFPAGTDPQAMALYGPYLYVANAGSDNVSVYPIDVNTGALAGPSTIATGKSPTSIVVDPFGGIVFVANHGGSNDISAFYFFDLTPVPGSPFPAGGNPLSLAVGGVGAGGKFLYTANPDATNPSISGFSVDSTSGVLSALSGSPFPIPVSHYIATDQTGAYLYVISGPNIVGYDIDTYTGALTALPGFPVSAGANAYSMSIDPTNQFLYVANDGAANITGFRLEASTGALTPMSGSPFPAGNRPDFLVTF